MVQIKPLLTYLTYTTGEMNKTKRRGPRTLPCGTPVSEVSQEEDDESTEVLTRDSTRVATRVAFL